MSSPIICGIDGSKDSGAVAQVGRAIAERLSIRLELLQVTTEGNTAERLARARGLVESLGDLGASVTLRVETGSPAERLIAASRRAALLVIGSPAEGALRHILAGGVSTAVTQSAAAPVIVVPPRAVGGPPVEVGGGAVVCGIRDDQDVACAGTAACWARELNVRLTLAHVMPPPRLPIVAAGPAPPPGLALSAAERAAAAVAMLDEMASAVSAAAPAASRTLVVDGRVGPQLDRLAEAENASLVAVGPRRHGALASALTGSPSRHLIRRGSRPVMICPSRDAVLG